MCTELHLGQAGLSAWWSSCQGLTEALPCAWRGAGEELSPFGALGESGCNASRVHPCQHAARSMLWPWRCLGEF